MIFFYSVVLTMRMCVFINESRIKPPLQWARNFLSLFDFLSTSALAKKNKTAEERLASLQGTSLGDTFSDRAARTLISCSPA